MSPRLISCLLVIITSLSVCQDSFFTEICNQKFQHCCKCDSSLLSVVCFKCPLIEALLVPSWTRIISIQYCHMTLLDLANFNASGRLEILIFTHNDLEVIHPGTFDQLVNLRLLDLSHNQLVSLPQNLLVNSEKLQILHLSNNNFDNLDVIGKLLPTELTLEQLSLNKNNFAYANGNVKIPSAKSLDLSGNQMIRKLIGNRIYLSSVDYLATIDTESLEQLTLAHCKAEVLVDFEFGRLYKGLKNLDLTDNSITSSNGNLISLLMLTNLTHLNLSQSALSIGSWNWYLSNLITLNISYSMVDSIQFHQESQLQVLDVSGNDVGEISHLEHLPDLQMLSASYNVLMEIPKSTKPLKNLKVLRLDYNQISQVHMNALAKYQNLRFVTLSGNRISRFSPIAFGLSSVVNLEELSLANNNISTFDGIEALGITRLNLSGNPIKSLSSGAFDKFDGLKSLSLRGNLHKSSLDFSFLGRLNQLESIDLSHNNLTYLPQFGSQINRFNLASNQLSTLIVNELLDRINLVSCRDWQLDLSNNRMTHFPNILKTLELLNVCGIEWNLDVDYSANPFECSCQLLTSLQQLYRSVTLSPLLLGLDNSYNFTPGDSYYCYNAKGEKLPFGQFVQLYEAKCKVDIGKLSPTLIALLSAIGLLIIAGIAALIVTLRFNWLRQKFGQYRYTPLNWGFGYQQSDSSNVSCQYV